MLVVAAAAAALRRPAIHNRRTGTDGALRGGGRGTARGGREVIEILLTKRIDLSVSIQDSSQAIRYLDQDTDFGKRVIPEFVYTRIYWYK